MIVATATSIFGTLPGWLTLAALLGAAWLFKRGGGGTAIESLVTANRVLEQRVDALETAGKEKDAQIAELLQKTDVTIATRPIAESLTAHEDRAAARHEATLKVLGLIAERLGPDES